MVVPVGPMPALKQALITGGARGIGFGIAQAMLEAGYAVTVTGLTPDEVAAVPVHPNLRAVRLDVTDDADVAACLGAFTRLDALVNCAGIILREGKEFTIEGFRRVIDVNLTGTFLCGREGAALMATGGEGGVIINISSIARAGNMGQSNYAASKAGVASLVVTWGKELARHGIRVMGIAPGVFATDMTAAMKPEAMARMQQAIPVGTLGQAAQLAQTVQFILANDYLSGRMIELDGGLRL